MRPRLAHGAVLLALVVATPALAAPKPVCKLVVDPAGDARPDPNVPSRESIDVLSADVATGRNNLVAVVRLASVAADPTLALGRTYRFFWNVGTVQQQLTFYEFADGSRLALFDPNVRSGHTDGEREVDAVVDAATNSVVWTVKRKHNPALATKGSKLRAFRVLANPGVNVTGENIDHRLNGSIRGDSPLGDEALSGASYLDGSLSCVKGV